MKQWGLQFRNRRDDIVPGAGWYWYSAADLTFVQAYREFARTGRPFIRRRRGEQDRIASFTVFGDERATLSETELRRLKVYI